MFVDTHCHIYNEYYEDIDKLMEKVKNNNIKFIINNACNIKTAKEILELSNRFDNMFVVVGLHPEENLDEIDKMEEIIIYNVNNNKMVGIGEIGLDYYWNKETKEEQKKVFIKQLELARKYNLPVIIHSRESTGDMLDILKNYKLKGIIHCFNGSVEVAKEYIKMGYKLGINGVVTFKNCKLIDTLKIIGIDNIVFETDSPYLTPVPDRGKTNDPSYINKIAKFLSEELNVGLDKLAEISNNNVSEIFDIK
ncbi:MAG: TatD family hydrolase [Bacilli bacterium]|nr:TatD family hydrolase [Bacilli bacterium]